MLYARLTCIHVSMYNCLVTTKCLHYMVTLPLPTQRESLTPGITLFQTLLMRHFTSEAHNTLQAPGRPGGARPSRSLPGGAATTHTGYLYGGSLPPSPHAAY